MRRCSAFALALSLLVFTLPLLAQTPVILHTFTGPDGAQPVGTFVQAYDGSLIGTTNAGGANGFGSVYSITTSGQFTSIYSFTGGNDGANPASGVTLAPDGSAYGTTQNGGANGVGTAWKISSTGAFTPLHAFGGTANSAKGARGGAVDGEGPTTQPFWGPNETFWGTTTGGGGDDLGTIYTMTPDGEITIVHEFGGPDGDGPTGGLLWASDGNFYGTAQYGGLYGYGTLFRITPDGTFTVLWDFTGGEEDGGYPCAGLEEDPDGTLWGETMVGGLYGDGTDFSWSISEGRGTTTYDYDDGDGNNPDFTLFLGGNGNFFGTTNIGGASGYGTAFSFDPSSPKSLNYLLSFNGADGAYPSGGVFQALDGNLYTTTQYGGSESDQGFILKFPITPLLPPISTISLSVETIQLGQSAVLSWAVNKGYSMTRRNCFAMGTDTSEWSGWQPPTGSITLTPTAVGTYDYALICGGGILAWNYLDVTTASKYPTSTALSAPTSVVLGANATLTATVTGQGGTPTGNVQFQFMGQTFATAALNGSGVASATFSTAGFPLGTYSITAVYVGDTTHYGSTSSASSVSLTKDPTTTTLTSSATMPIIQGAPLTLTAAVTGGSGTQRPTGEATFYASVNGGPRMELATVALNNQQKAVYMVDTSIVPAGDYSITAIYSGDQTFASSSSSAANVTIKGATTVSVMVMPNPLVAGAVTNLTVIVSSDTAPAPEGSVYVGGLTLTLNNAGVATWTGVGVDPAYAPGQLTVTATYPGDATHGASSGSTVVDIIGTTTTTLQISPSSATAGQQVTFTATVMPAASSGPMPTGSVSFSLQGTSFGTAMLNSGKATYKATIPSYLAKQAYQIQATYSGDSNYAGSSGNGSLTVK